jgi:hypothetical protein
VGLPLRWLPRLWWLPWLPWLPRLCWLRRLRWLLSVLGLLPRLLSGVSDCTTTSKILLAGLDHRPGQFLCLGGSPAANNFRINQKMPVERI